LLEDEKTGSGEGTVHLEEVTGGGKSRARRGAGRSRKKP
jgi:hypothetical protein